MLKLFRATVADDDNGSRKFLHTFLYKYLHCLRVKCNQNRLVRTTRRFKLSVKKLVFKPFLDESVGVILKVGFF